MSPIVAAGCGQRRTQRRRNARATCIQHGKRDAAGDRALDGARGTPREVVGDHPAADQALQIHQLPRGEQDAAAGIHTHQQTPARHVQPGLGLIQVLARRLVLGSDGLALRVGLLELRLEVVALGAELAHPPALLLKPTFEILGGLCGLRLQRRDLRVPFLDLALCALTQGAVAVQLLAHLGEVVRDQVEEAGAFLGLGLQNGQEGIGVVFVVRVSSLDACCCGVCHVVFVDGLRKRF
jgi:hypothetical protein